jgi:hypothetical protein
MKEIHPFASYLAIAVLFFFGVVPYAGATSAIVVDFDAFMESDGNLDPNADTNGDGDYGPSGILNGDEQAVISAILADASLDLSSSGGVNHDAVHAAYPRFLSAP